jgi:exonuclease VII small subunit
MKLPLQISLNPIVLKALCAVGLTCWCGYQQYQIYHLSAALAGTVNQDSIGSLIQRINSVEDRLDQSAKTPSVTMEDFRAGQQALSNRMDTLQTQIKKNQESTQAPSQSAASMLDIVALEAKFEGLQATFQDFVKSRPKPAPAPAPVKAVKSEAPPARKVEAIVKPLENPPPFTVVGVEYRGGERFLSVAPPGSTRLSQLYLVRPGDTIDGSNWRLSSLDDSRAQFSINGTSRIVPLNK